MSHVFFSPEFNASLDKNKYIAPPAALIHLSAGFQKQLADSFWLRALQDFDYCSEQKAEQLCVGQSWLYQILNLASMFDPFLEPVMYQTGGLALTVIISDYEGASKFFDKGVRIHPRNWQLIYAAAYHALYEEKNKLKASQLYLQAYENGAPDWTQVLAGRLAKEHGDEEFSQQILQKMIETNQNPQLIERLKNKLKR